MAVEHRHGHDDVQTPEPYASPRPIRVVVDHRERGCGVVAALEGFVGVDSRIAHLTLGDYLVDGDLLFERKTLADLAASIQDGRLFRQASRLAADPRRTAILLEGTASSLDQVSMRREAIQGALVSVTLMFGLPVLRARDATESAALMIYAARQARAWTTGAIPRRVRRPKGKRRAQLQMLQGLPGVGSERAARLLDEFGSVESVVGASAEALEAIDGIGPATAMRIRWVVSDASRSYLATPGDGAMPATSSSSCVCIHFDPRRQSTPA
ncbi:MAG: nuclease [Ectothiorhodospiraceae bacterium]|nr:nuclease [Ectothiorhodospiraceae bacterium]